MNEKSRTVASLSFTAFHSQKTLYICSLSSELGVGVDEKKQDILLLLLGLNPGSDDNASQFSDHWTTVPLEVYF